MSIRRTNQPVSSRRRVLRGWGAIGIGCAAIAAPLLIGDWALLFLFALAPMGLFILILGWHY
jgi:hypothetical protein